MPNDAQPADVLRWATLLRSRVSTERLKGATELASLAARTRTRGAIRTRGSISQAAPSRFPPDVSLADALAAFKDQHVEVRRAVAFALGEWADEAAVRVLCEVAATDSEAAVRGEAIDALEKIGGPQAVKVLTTAARNDPSIDVRVRTVRALADLARAEPSAAQGVIETLQHVQAQDSSDPVKDQATAALAELGRA